MPQENITHLGTLCVTCARGVHRDQLILSFGIPPYRWVWDKHPLSRKERLFTLLEAKQAASLIADQGSALYESGLVDRLDFSDRDDKGNHTTIQLSGKRAFYFRDALCEIAQTAINLLPFTHKKGTNT